MSVDVQPLDADGVVAIRIGTTAWLIAFAVLFAFFRDELQAHSTQWWLWVCLAGAALGIPGMWFTTRRRNAYRRAVKAA